MRSGVTVSPFRFFDTHYVIVIQSLIIAGALALGAAAASVSIFVVPATSIAPLAFGISVTLAGALIAQSLGHRYRARHMAARLNHLGVEVKKTTTKLSALRSAFDELMADYEAARSRETEHASELRELGRLVGQMAQAGQPRAGAVKAQQAGALPARATPYGPRSGLRAGSQSMANETTTVAAPQAPPLLPGATVGILSLPSAPQPVIELPPAERLSEPVPEDADQVERIREALLRHRIDLFVQPVVRLPNRRVAFYEAYSRLRARDGSPILPEAFIDLAETTGLITDIDNMLLFQCVEQIRRDVEQGVDGCYCCNISARTLADNAFFPQFVAYLLANESLSEALLFELPEHDLGRLSERAAHQLRRLTAARYGFVLDHVTAPKLDPEALAGARFCYVKVDAALLLPEIGAEPAVDVRYLKEELDIRGIGLIVEKIESEQMLLDLLDFDIDYGQGYLFGEPRRSR